MFKNLEIDDIDFQQLVGDLDLNSKESGELGIAARNIYRLTRELLNRNELIQKLTIGFVVEIVIGLIMVKSIGDAGPFAPATVEIIVVGVDVVIFILTVAIFALISVDRNDTARDLNENLSQCSVKPLSTRNLLLLSKGILDTKNAIPEKYRLEKVKSKRDHRVRLTGDGELEEVWGEDDDETGLLVNKR